MEEAFNACKEYKQGAVDASGTLCMYKVTKIVLESVTSIVLGGIIVDSLKSSGNTETKGSSPPNRLMARMETDESLRNNVLQQLNGQFTTEGLMATQIVPSHIHPHDGIAIRMNVHGDDSTLHVHTNGTSAMALFDQDATLQDRAILPSDGLHFKFGTIDGMKFQAHLVNKYPSGDYASDTIGFLNKFVRSNLKPQSIMSTHDQWKFQVCNKQKTATFFYGKYEAKENGFGKSYESISPSGCK